MGLFSIKTLKWINFIITLFFICLLLYLKIIKNDDVAVFFTFMIGLYGLFTYILGFEMGSCLKEKELKDEEAQK
jgi:hypothetical protein